MQCPECENHFGGNWVEHECIEPNEEFNLPSCGEALRYAIDDGTYYGAQHKTITVVDD